MMDADKPEYFADYLTRGYEVGDNMRKCIADELRRLHTENAALRAQLQGVPADEREAFEVWYTVECGLSGTDLESEFDKDEVGEYIYGGASDAWKVWQARAALKPAVPEGYQLVPIDATDKELAAGFEAMHRNLHLPTITTVEEIRTAMLAAAKDG